MQQLDFNAIYTEYQPRFVVFARRYVRDTAVAEDLVADSFVAFWESREKLNNDVNVPAYILTTVKNRCLNWLSTQQRHLNINKQIHTHNSRLVEQNISSLKLCDPDILFADEINKIVQRELESMPQLTRLIFQASRDKDKTYAQIAQEFNISTRRVTSEIQKSLALLRLALKDYMPAVCVNFIISKIVSSETPYS